MGWHKYKKVFLRFNVNNKQEKSFNYPTEMKHCRTENMEQVIYKWILRRALIIQMR